MNRNNTSELSKTKQNQYSLSRVCNQADEVLILTSKIGTRFQDTPPQPEEETPPPEEQAPPPDEVPPPPEEAPPHPEEAPPPPEEAPPNTSF